MLGVAYRSFITLAAAGKGVLCQPSKSNCAFVAAAVDDVNEFNLRVVVAEKYPVQFVGDAIERGRISVFGAAEARAVRDGFAKTFKLLVENCRSFSARICRFLPLIFLPASNPCGSIETPLFLGSSRSDCR